MSDDHVRRVLAGQPAIVRLPDSVQFDFFTRPDYSVVLEVTGLTNADTQGRLIEWLKGIMLANQHLLSKSNPMLDPRIRHKR